MKKLSIITLICGVVLVLSSVSVAMLVTLTANTSPIGIIGGADIPTTKLIIYSILNGWPIYILVSGTVLIIAAVFCLFFGKTVEKHCSPKTTILALATSFCGAAGLSCLLLWYSIVRFHEMSTSPIEYIFSKIAGLICLAVFVVLIVYYCKTRKKSFSVKGIVIDVLTSVLFLPIFFLIITEFSNLFV